MRRSPRLIIQTSPPLWCPDIGAQQELRIVVYGDMRFTNPANTKDTNPRARKWLAEKVGTVHSDAMVITGDVPFHGSDPRDWEVFEKECASWARAAAGISDGRKP